MLEIVVNKRDKNQKLEARWQKGAQDMKFKVKSQVSGEEGQQV